MEIKMSKEAMKLVAKKDRFPLALSLLKAAGYEIEEPREIKA